MKVHIVPALAAGLLLGAVAAPSVSAAPAFAQPGLIAGSAATVVDWHPSTSHWDHHFHAHQESLQFHQPTEAEQQIRRSMRRAAPYAQDRYGSAPRYRLGTTEGSRR